MSLNSHGVVLDTTLRDLYSLEENVEPDIVLIYAIPTAEVQISRSLPLSTKFMYQSPLVLTKNADELARLYLQVVPQLFGFIAGNMPLIMFDLDIDDGESMQSTLSSSSPQQAHQADAFRVLDQLASSQRPKLSFVSSPKTIFLSPGTKAAVANPMDCMLHLPHTVDPEVHYKLLSKKNLALSGLPTPESEVIRTNLQPHQIYDESSLDAEVVCMMEPILNYTLPFVIKLPQSSSGKGVFLIHTESDRGHAIEVLRIELKRTLQILNESTQDMQSCSLVAQKMISGEAVALAFFLTRTGRPIFTSCCKQIVDVHGHWEGGFISYQQQERLQRQYAGTVEKLSRFMHEKGYYGPIGCDVMTDQDGTQLIIDLNVRVSGSHPLGFLRNHFSVERQLHEAVLFFMLHLKCTMEEFERAFKNEFKNGSLVVTGWCHDKQGKSSYASIILGAEDPDKLRGFIDRVNVYRLFQ